MIKITKAAIRRGDIKEVSKDVKIDVDQSIQLANYMNSTKDIFSRYVWWTSNQFYGLTYWQAAKVIAENNGFQIEYLKHIIVALHPEKYKI